MYKNILHKGVIIIKRLIVMSKIPKNFMVILGALTYVSCYRAFTIFALLRKIFLAITTIHLFKIILHISKSLFIFL